MDATDRVSVDAPIGRVTGRRRGDVDHYLGLRFAAAPTGALRFRPPQRLPVAMEAIDATTHGGRCHQAGIGVEVIFPDLPVEGAPGEDCLFLNVHASASTDGAKAVLVWIHGGAFMNGSGNDYDPSRLVEDDDLVVVTVNYRLGIFGFLDMTSLGGEFAESVNLGIQDQIAALQWIRDNIAAFGGDPDNVTISGESAGASSVFALLGAPAAQGLFHKAIAFSGAETLAPPTNQLAALTAYLGEPSDAATAERLIDMPSEELAALQLSSGFYPGTVLDGRVIAAPACEAIIDGPASSIPVLAGTVTDEGTFLTPYYAVDDAVTLAVVAGLAAGVSRDDGAGYREWLEREVGLDRPSACMERAWFDLFRSSAVRVAATASQYGAGGWVYDFDVPTDHELGVTHFADVPFTFNWVRDGSPREFVHPSTSENRAVAAAWSSTIAAFALTGSPNGHGLPKWPRYEAPSFRSLRVSHRSEVVENPDGALLDVYRVPRR